METPQCDPPEGILLVDKPVGIPSFRLVSQLRRLTGVRKIGHAGTLDPFATGVMVLLVGRSYTRLSDRFLSSGKEYLATLHLGVETTTYDTEGEVVSRSDSLPSLEEIELALESFQGEVEQVPPIYSAKRVQGRRMYELARKGIEIERAAVRVTMRCALVSYDYPTLTLRVECSKGTYIRSIGHDLGHALGCGAHLSQLIRTRSGEFSLDRCLDGRLLEQSSFDVRPHLLEVACA